jgi:hypothetical protein
MLTPFARRVTSDSGFEPIQSCRRLILGPFAKLNPRNIRSCGRATARYASFTLSLSLSVIYRVMLSITY